MTEGDNYLLQQTHTLVCRIDRILTGGDDPEKGVVIKVDRLTQAHRFWKRVFWTVVAGIIPGIGAILTWFLGKV